MDSRTRATTTALILAVLLAAPSAHARFGKSDSGSNNSSSSHSDRPTSSSEHKAAPAISPSSNPSPAPYRRGHVHVHRPGFAPAYPVYERHYHYGWGYGYYPYFGAPVPVAVGATAAEPNRGLSTTFGVTAQAHSQGATLGLGMAVEGERFGVNADLSAILAQEPGAAEVDAIRLIDVHLTYALLASEYGRLRLEGGFGSAIAPEIAFFGPDVGASAVLGLIGTLGLEGAAHFTPLPHRRVDWNVGLTLALGPLGFRGGIKYLWLDDAGHLDGQRHTDTFFGPYVGAGLVF